jgi:hypothetical protein
VEEKTGILSSDEIAQELLRLSCTAFEIHCPQDSNHIFKKELGIICPAVLQPLGPRSGDLLGYALLFLHLWIQESKDS